jgi:hypothetical protein
MRGWGGMPEHKIHRMIDRLFLGKEREDVHAWMDEPYKWLGPKHRILRHDPITLLLKYYDDPEGFLAGLLHIATDWGVSEFNKSRKNAKRKKRKSKTKRQRRR